MPAMNCKRPPAKRARPTAAFGVWMSRVLTLYSDSRSPVPAKENKPLEKEMEVHYVQKIS